MSFAAAALFFCSPVFSQDGLPLLRKMQDALGGADKLAAIRDLEQYVIAESFNGNTGRSMGAVRKRTRWIRPSYLRLDQEGPGSTYVLYFDGTAGWEILPGTKEVIALAGGELLFAQNYERNFQLNLWLADRFPRYRVTSPSANVVQISTGDTTNEVFTLDPASGLPLKSGTMSLSDPAHPMTSESVWTTWEDVQGMRFPRSWTVLRSGIKVAEAKDNHTTVNVGLKLEDLAAKPPDMKPVLSSR